MKGSLAIISGTGNLPRLLAEDCQAKGQNYCVTVLKGTEIDWRDGHPVLSARIEKISKLFNELREMGCKSVVFAGAITRPAIDPQQLDELGRKLASEILGASQKGDDATLRFVIELFEGEGFDVFAPNQILPDLLPDAGVLTHGKPSDTDIEDSTQAAEIVNALGNLDVGQGAVVSNGLCLGMESIQGTDAMLKFVADTLKYQGGVLLKAPKPTQDLRIDMPTIGVETIRNAHDAGLSGIVIGAGGVLVLGLQECIAEAEKRGLFLWVRE